VANAPLDQRADPLGFGDRARLPGPRLADVSPSAGLREDNRTIVRAASAASKAADYLLAFCPGADVALALDNEQRQDVCPLGFVVTIDSATTSSRRTIGMSEVQMKRTSVTHPLEIAAVSAGPTLDDRARALWNEFRPDTGDGEPKIG